MSRPFFPAMDHVHMAHALRLAEQGLHTTQPNPRVGCVIARGDTVLGTGWHQRAGEPHAEVHALREAGTAARGATAYVTLEPCAHFGRTPPCADALIAAGVGRVVIAHEDPFDKVAGAGIEKLRAADIGVQVGLMRDAAHELNIGFFSRIQRGRPWVRVKLAMSLDGRTALANGSSKWITGDAARADVQRWRARASAILSASGTVLADDPHLTVRLPGEARFVPPLRAIVDTTLRTPASAHVLDGTAPSVLLHAPDVPVPAHLADVPRVAIRRDERGGLDLAAVLHWLALQDANEVHVEAGPALCGALLAAGLADELLVYIAPVLLGDSARPMLHLPPLDDMASRWKLYTVDRRQVGDDTRLQLRPHAVVPAKPGVQ
ncbi:bifunctional diaminohydroxyphosphoribosylaminopyrimidine deaminase/5-amino-6-(5-phosphoribosylamino)uracil reductase RibD [Luteibacter sp. NPDC031894]|uniref:bifunctional diaminohydroxyphosphoribosylaminopyrimidine deaminase/5-amino-6-(5-phosphoribosylamino)uracil reductase RibD n=1 Tax=Luteibacter sp. NPDC031894 TaxID=3390572 RepID=UPI003D063D83